MIFFGADGKPKFPPQGGGVSTSHLFVGDDIQNLGPGGVSGVSSKLVGLSEESITDEIIKDGTLFRTNNTLASPSQALALSSFLLLLFDPGGSSIGIYNGRRLLVESHIGRLYGQQSFFDSISLWDITGSSSLFNDLSTYSSLNKKPQIRLNITLYYTLLIFFFEYYIIAFIWRIWEELLNLIRLNCLRNLGVLGQTLSLGIQLGEPFQFLSSIISLNKKPEIRLNITLYYTLLIFFFEYYIIAFIWRIWEELLNLIRLNFVGNSGVFIVIRV
jgi:hypothetical protein